MSMCLYRALALSVLRKRGIINKLKSHLDVEDLLGEPVLAGEALAVGLRERVWELDLVVLGWHHHEDLLAADVLVVLDLVELDDLDVAVLDVVLAGHFVEDGLHGAGRRDLADLAVHVVVADAVSVAELDGEVLDLGLVLDDLLDGDGLAVALLDLLEVVQEVPVAGLGDDLVRGEDRHLVDLWIRLLLGRNSAAQHDELLHHKKGVVDGIAEFKRNEFEPCGPRARCSSRSGCR